MAVTFESLYPASGTAITCTFASLASGAARQSTVINNATNLDVDALVQIKVLTGTVSGTAYVNVWGYASADNGTTYSDGATGTDSAITLTSSPNMRLLAVINTPSSATAYVSDVISIAQAYNVLPQKWGIVIQNQTGGALGASGCSAFYTRIQQQGV